MRISPNITYAEAFKSQQGVRLGIKNTTNDPDVLKNMKHVADSVFEKIRAHFDMPIGISSFYRSPKLNEAINGSDKSQHIKGEAIDIDADIFGGVTNSEIFNWVKENLEFDQLIWEFGTSKNPAWVHVSLKRVGKNRNQIIKIK